MAKEALIKSKTQTGLETDLRVTTAGDLSIGGISRTTNPTATTNGSNVGASFDDLGRQLVRPMQVRDLITTARVTVSNGTETTLLAGSAGVLRDLIAVHATNNSTAATTIDFRSTTAGSVVFTLDVPAAGVGNSNPWISFPVPYPVSDAGAWTIDLPDITGTTITVDALFSNEV